MKNNKTFKKIASAATAAILASCAMMPMTFTNVSAATINITNSQKNHTYNAYQIFSGKLSQDGTTLSNIDWGTGVKNTGALLTEIKKISGFDQCANAADVALKLTEKKDDSAVIQSFQNTINSFLADTPTGTTDAFNNGTYSINVPNDGYYFVKDADNSLNGQADKTYTDYILEVIGTETIEVKSDLPAFSKTVTDKLDTNSSTDANQTSADYDIGDSVPFHLEATVDKTIGNYTTYELTIHDKLATGLTLDENSIEVKVGNTKLTKETDYSVNTSTADGDTFDIVFSNLKAVSAVTAGCKITVDYNATLNQNAIIGDAGNPNEAYIEYSNNPNSSSSKGESPVDLVKVYTYDLIIDKIKAADKQALAGAEFSLQKNIDGIWQPSKTPVKKALDGVDGATFEFHGIDDGFYKLTEDTTPDGYNAIPPIYFKVEATHTENGVNPLTAVQVNEDGSGFTGTPLIFDCTPFSEGKIEADVENQKGSELPSTGGIGTTPFYVGGGVLVAAAGIYIIVRKRMKNNENNSEK